jgi:polyhydroxyalkanoate synthesis regulator phasin
MLKRHAELTDDVVRLENLVEEQRRELEKQNSNRFGTIYDDIDDGTAITQDMVDEENAQVRALEQHIESLQSTVQLNSKAR